MPQLKTLKVQIQDPYISLCNCHLCVFSYYKRYKNKICYTPFTLIWLDFFGQ